MTINIALIGAGRIGAVHTNELVTAVPRAAVVAVADAALPRAEALARGHGINMYTSDADEAINSPDVDAVVIASSTDTHARYIIAAAEAGKHIFCEKPIAADLAEIDRALAAVEEAGVKLQIGFNRRFDPTFARLQRAVAEGDIGTPHLMHIISRDPSPPPIEYVKVSGGLFFDMMIHDFDMARFLLGEVESVYAVGAALVDEAIGAAGDIDTAVVTLRFANGAIGTIDNSRKAVYGYDQRAEVFGSKGSASTANLYPDAVTISTANTVRRGSLPLNFFLERYADAYRIELMAFVAAVADNTPVPVTGADGRAPVVMAMAADLSRRENRPVAISEIEGTS